MICAVDVGSTMIKAAVYATAPLPVVSVARPLPRTTSGPHAEADADLLWQAVAEAVRDATSQASGIDVLVFTAQMAGMVLLDGENRPAAPVVLGIDRRHEPTAGPIRDARQIARLRWWAEHRPTELEAAARIGGVRELLVLRACGAWVTDPSCASVTGYYD